MLKYWNFFRGKYGAKFLSISKKKRFYYAQIAIDSGMVWKSTKTTNRDTAAAIVGRWLVEGFPVNKTKAKNP